MSSGLLHLANLAFLASFAARDVLWLRLLCILGASLLVAMFLRSDPVPWDAVAWQLLFVAIHAGWCVAIWRERRPVPLDPDEAHLRAALFPALSTRELARLCRAGRWRTAEAGAALCAEGEALDRLLVVVAGEARVERAGAVLATLGPGRFVGERAWLLGERASAAVVAGGPVRWLEWPADELRALLGAHPELRTAVQRALGADLARKLGPTTPGARG